MADSEQNAKTNNNLEKDKMDVECKLHRLSSDYNDLRDK
jgi:hypothetical protein